MKNRNELVSKIVMYIVLGQLLVIIFALGGLKIHNKISILINRMANDTEMENYRLQKKNKIENKDNSDSNESDNKKDLNHIDWTPDAVKPIIYLYPENTTELTVTLGKPEKISCSYPKYVNGWHVLAEKSGKLIDLDTNKELYSLYWEGKNNTEKRYIPSEGFIIKGEDSAEFLEEKLEILGLNWKEAEEFIIYWLPKLEENKYNYIRFATLDEINEFMPLEISEEPDTMIRILMQYKGLEEPVEVTEQKLETPERKGFVVVEWGGSEIK